jgi:hypothetical protein
LSKLRFAPWGTTCGFAARYAERLGLSSRAPFCTTCFPPREGSPFPRRKKKRRFRPERPSLSAKQGAKPPGALARSPWGRGAVLARGCEHAPLMCRSPKAGVYVRMLTTTLCPISTHAAN